MLLAGSLASYVWRVFASHAGGHRYFAHDSFKTTKWLELAMAMTIQVHARGVRHRQRAPPARKDAGAKLRRACIRHHTRRRGPACVLPCVGLTPGLSVSTFSHTTHGAPRGRSLLPTRTSCPNQIVPNP